jgi:hypothetical protein
VGRNGEENIDITITDHRRTFLSAHGMKSLNCYYVLVLLLSSHVILNLSMIMRFAPLESFPLISIN